MTEPIGGSCGEVMAMENEHNDKHLVEDYGCKTYLLEAFQRTQNGMQCTETRSRTKAEADNRNQKNVGVLSEEEEASLTLENNTEDCKDELERKISTSVLSRIGKPLIFADSAEITNATADGDIEEGFIRHAEVALSTSGEKQVSTPARVEASPIGDENSRQKIPAAPKVKSCEEGVLDFGEQEAKVPEEDTSSSRSTRKRKKRAIDYPSEVSQSPRKLEKRHLTTGKQPNKVNGKDTGKTSKIYAKEVPPVKVFESNVEGNGCDGSPDLDSKIKKRKRFETEILQTGGRKKKNGRGQTKHKLDSDNDDLLSVFRAKKLKKISIPFAEISDEGTVFSHIVARNLPYVRANGRLEICKTKGKLGQSTSGSAAPVSETGMLLRCNGVGSSSEIKGNKKKKLLNRRISERIVSKAKVKSKATGVLIKLKHQRVTGHASKMKRQTEKKPAIAELRKSLRERAKDHLLAAGWKIDLRPRKERKYQDSVYISPSGLSFWSLPRAWKALKQSLDEKITKEEEFSDSLHDRMLSGNDSSSSSDKEILIKPLEGVHSKQKLDTFSLMRDEVSEISSFMTMIYTEDLGLLKRKRKIQEKKDINKKNEFRKDKKSSKNGGKNGQVMNYLDSRQIFHGKTKNTNCNSLDSMGPVTEVCEKMSKNEKLLRAGKTEVELFKQRKKKGKVSEQPKLLQKLQKKSCNKNYVKGLGKARNKVESANAQVVSTKALGRGIEKKCQLDKTAKLKASSEISMRQNVKDRNFSEPQKSSKPQAGRKSSVSQSRRKSKGLHAEKCHKTHTESRQARLECGLTLNKIVVSVGDGEFLSASVSKKRKRGQQVAKSSKDNARKKNPKNGKKKKNRRGGCGLLVRSSSKGNDHDRFSATSKRTVLSWLIDVGAVCENEMVQYINEKDNTIMINGWLTRDGILCKCCNRILTTSDFESHAGSKLLQPNGNIFLASGKSLTQCQMQAWVEQTKSRKTGMCIVEVDEVDQNDDTCGLCGDGGDLICCDKCPSTFHQECLVLKDLPDGNWYCPNCTCAICATVGNEGQEQMTDTTTVLLCDQCENKYHKECLNGRGIHEGGSMTKNSWFCGHDCEQVFIGLRDLLAISNPLEGGFSWTLLRCIEEDQEVCSAQRLALMAECNTKLAVALVVMEECFVPMVDPRTELDMIPHVVYNCGSNFNRLNYQGFYTVVLEKGNELISVASIRIHGSRLAEMPFVGTRHQYRRQGMCRLLMNAIEKMLLSLKVEKLILPAIPDLLETWKTAFCFNPLEDSHKEEIRNISMMVFPGTTLLQKSICKPIIRKDKQTAGDLLGGFRNVDSEAQAQRKGAEIHSHGETCISKWYFPNEVNVISTMRENEAFGLLPEEEERETVSESSPETSDGKDLESALAEGDERSFTQSICSQTNMESQAFLKLKQSIKLVPAFSESIKVLETSVDNQHPAAIYIGDSAAFEDSTSLQRREYL
eukprot:Gb_41247 [translate_table: standard]